MSDNSEQGTRHGYEPPTESNWRREWRDVSSDVRRWVAARQSWDTLKAVPPWMAWFWVLGLYIVGGWAGGTYNAIRFLLGDLATPPVMSWPQVGRMAVHSIPPLVAAGLGLGACAKVGATAARLGLLPENGWRTIAIDGVIVSLLAWSSKISFTIGFSIGGSENAQNSTGSTYARVANIIHGTAAGIGEEVAILAVPVVILRAARQPWWAIVVAATALRLSFHTYYGWGTLGLTVWALTSLALFVATRRLLPLIVAHVLWNVVPHITGVADSSLWFTMTFGVLGAVVLLANRSDAAES